MKLFLLFILVLTVSSQVFSIDWKGLGFVAPGINGKGQVYQPKVGEILFDSSDSKFYGLKSNDPSNEWVELSYTDTSTTPAGVIQAYAGTTAPSGYLIADGSAVDRTTYASLYAVIGDAYGEGDGSTTFNLPDLRGKFVRGFDNTAGNDPDASSRVACATGGNTGDNIGSCQSDELKSHDHYVQYSTGASGSSGWTTNAINNQTTWDATSTSTEGGSESRPTNVSANYIIKY